MRGHTRIDQVLRHAAFNQGDTLTRYTFTVEGRARLERMIDIVDDVDVRPEKLCVQPFIEKRALFQESRSSEIKKHEADQVEHCRRLQHNGVLSRGEFLRSCRFQR